METNEEIMNGYPRNIKAKDIYASNAFQDKHILSMMDEARKQEAKAFAEWLKDQDHALFLGEKCVDQLYAEFTEFKAGRAK